MLWESMTVQVAKDSPDNAIVIRGARTHNLKNIDLTLPQQQVIVVTGVSGSGKSSLAFDTVYAEGQRRYVESLSAYARQFLERMEKPDVDGIDGICPAIALRQKNSVRNPRSTVGTTTEIHDYLRLLFARVGRTICRGCGRQVVRETAELVANRLSALAAGTKLILGFDMPVVSLSSGSNDSVELEVDEISEHDMSSAGEVVAQKTDRKKRNSKRRNADDLAAQFQGNDNSILDTIDALRRKGFGRLYVKGRVISFDEVNVGEMADCADIQVVVDRLKLSPDAVTRLTDSIETAYQ